MGSSQYLIDVFKLSMMSKFDMIDLDVLHYFFGLEVYQGDHNIFISKKKFMLDMLKKFNILNFKTISTPINTSEKFCINDWTSKTVERLFRKIVLQFNLFNTQKTRHYVFY